MGAPPHVPGGVRKSARWQNSAVEPTAVELKNGRARMLMRTSQDVLYESFSYDGGETWGAARPSRLYSTLTMRTLGRLKDGRILFLWNDTTPLPEVARDESHKFFVGWGAIGGPAMKFSQTGMSFMRQFRQMRARRGRVFESCI